MKKSDEVGIKRIHELSQKILDGVITEAELLEFDLWYTSFDDHVVESLTEEELIELGKNLYQKISCQKKNNVKIFIKRISACAAVILMLIVGAWVYKYNVDHDSLLSALNDRAFIRDKDGNLTPIDSLSVGESQRMGSLILIKKEDGLIELKENTNIVNTDEKITIVTPRGVENKFQLPDSTLIWMNANSKIEFMAAFRGKERNVSISGEAYFEVRKDSKRPFIVTTDFEKIVVLGTKFNISAYPDDEKHTTSLTEGKVLLKDKEAQSNDVQLIPGQQAIRKGDKLTVRNFDSNEVLAWKNGEFIFNQTRLEDVSKILGRWYDVEFTFSDMSLKEVPIWGTLSKKESLKDILSVIEQTQAAKFEIKEGRIMVEK